MKRQRLFIVVQHDSNGTGIDRLTEGFAGERVGVKHGRIGRSFRGRFRRRFCGSIRGIGGGVCGIAGLGAGTGTKEHQGQSQQKTKQFFHRNIPFAVMVETTKTDKNLHKHIIPHFPEKARAGNWKCRAGNADHYIIYK